MRLEIIQLWLEYFNFACAISTQVLNEIISLFFKISSNHIELDRGSLRRQLANLKGFILVTDFSMIWYVL